MNIKTKIIAAVIIIYTLGVVAVAITGTFLPKSVDADYIRQSVAERQVQGGGVNFGK
ncbi:hypothetical protein KC909_03675 [Candidatus Dojkabacteria bacterium]|uniref:Uncharacterized protein n=1 Tax=Candidatus Dojkabacteria bacterium TaxID=2099670 RepID=A0A955L5T9_9BACT|nr:hypothetical protein [Candidatus Dojkabacteria bacterium]